MQTTAESKARILGQPLEDPKFLPGQAQLRWSRFKNLDADVMFKTVAPRCSHSCRSTATRSAATTRPNSEHMKDARFTIPNAAMLSKVVDMLDQVPMDNRDTNGDLYGYMLLGRRLGVRPHHPPVGADLRHAAGALPHADVPRLRLRQRDAADRLERHLLPVRATCWCSDAFPYRRR